MPATGWAIARANEDAERDSTTLQWPFLLLDLERVRIAVDGLYDLALGGTA